MALGLEGMFLLCTGTRSSDLSIISFCSHVVHCSNVSINSS